MYWVGSFMRYKIFKIETLNLTFKFTQRKIERSSWILDTWLTISLNIIDALTHNVINQIKFFQMLPTLSFQVQPKLILTRRLISPFMSSYQPLTVKCEFTLLLCGDMSWQMAVLHFNISRPLKLVLYGRWTHNRKPHIYESVCNEIIYSEPLVSSM